MIDFSTPPRIVFGARASSRVGGPHGASVSARWLSRGALPIAHVPSSTVSSGPGSRLCSSPWPVNRRLRRRWRLCGGSRCVGDTGRGRRRGLRSIAGKAIAALATNAGDVFDYLEVIGRGHPMVTAALPVVAVPTTAGTGSEVTRNAVLASPEHRVKVSLRHASMFPRVAIVDPALRSGCRPRSRPQLGSTR